MTMLVLNILLAVAWAMMYGEFSLPNILVGLVLGYIILRLAVGRGPQRSPYFAKVLTTIGFVVYCLKELVIANVKMAVYTCSPLRSLKPMILAVPLRPGMTDVEITVLANLVTLTPGTLSLDVSQGRDTLFVHMMNVADPDAEIRAIKDGFERRLLEVTR